MITWNEALHTHYPNLLVLARLALVQCVSTTTCERAFSIQNLIKTRVRNRLGSKNLEAMLRVALEGPEDDANAIICDAILLWKNDTKYRFLYSNPETHLNTVGRPSLSNTTYSSGALQNDGSNCSEV